MSDDLRALAAADAQACAKVESCLVGNGAAYYCLFGPADRCDKVSALFLALLDENDEMRAVLSGPHISADLMQQHNAHVDTMLRYQSALGRILQVTLSPRKGDRTLYTAEAIAREALEANPHD